MSLWDECLYDDRRENSIDDFYDDVRLQREREEEEERKKMFQRLYWDEYDRLTYEATKKEELY